MLCRTGINLEIHGLNSDVLYEHMHVGVKSRMQCLQLINPEQTERDDHALRSILRISVK